MARKNLINNMDGIDFRTYINDNFIEVYNNLTSAIIKQNYELNPDTNAFTDALKNKLDNLSDTTLSDSDIKIAYENNDDTNAFTDSEKNKLEGLGNNIINIVSSGIVDISKNIHIIDATSGNISLILPLASTVNKTFVFKRIDNTVNTVSITVSGSDLIDNVGSINLNTFDSASIVSNTVDRYFVI